jgi:peptidyl-prolyl cis-trans isomerase SurA
MTLTRGTWLAGVVCALGLAAGAGGCGGGGKPAASSPDVWAMVGDHEIRRDEVEKAYRSAIDPNAAQPTEVEVAAAKLSIVDELISQELVLARAKALNLDVTDAEVDTAFAERKRAMSDDAFQQQLKQRSLTIDDMKRAVRRELTVQKLMDREVVSKVAVTDQEIADFYGQNRAQFNVAEPQYHIAQIVITPVRDQQLRNRKNDDAATPADAQTKAQMLMERLRSGAQFSELAMDYSEDPQTAPRGGDLGFVSVSQLNQVPPQLRDAVLKSEPGNVKVVSAAGAHTLVMLVAKEAAGQRDVSDPTVRDGIRDTLRQRKEQVLRTAYLAAARNDARIVNFLAQQIVDAQGKMPGLTPAPPGK